MNNSKWIREKIRNNPDIKSSKALYREFTTATGSTCSLKTFRNLFYRMKKAVNAEDTVEFDAAIDEDSVGEMSSFQINGNAATATGTITAENESPESFDPEEIAKSWGIDLEKWQVKAAETRKKPEKLGGRSGTLHWRDRAIDHGDMDYTEQYLVDVYVVKLVLIARKIDKIDASEIVQPIQVESFKHELSFEQFAPDTDNRVLIFGDAQIGYRREGNALYPLHDRRAISAVLSVLEKYKFTKVIINGDMLDLTEFTDKFLVGPAYAQTFQIALLEFHWILNTIRAYQPDAEIIYVEGNHEVRLTNSLTRKMESVLNVKSVDDLEGFPALSLPSLLNLQDLNIHWRGNYPNNFFWLRDDIVVSHSEKDKTNADAMKKDLFHTEIIGHIHSVFSRYKLIHHSRNKKVVGLHGTGCLCHLDDRVPGKGNRRNWQQGFVVANYSNTLTNDPHVLSVLIQEGSYQFGNHLTYVDSYLEDMRKDYDTEFFANLED